MYPLGPCVQRRVEASRIRPQRADTRTQDYLEVIRFQIAFYVQIAVAMHPAEFDARWRVDVASRLDSLDDALCIRLGRASRGV